MSYYKNLSFYFALYIQSCYICSMEEHIMDIKKVKSSALVLRAINHKLRGRILSLLHDRDFMSVTDIYIALRIEQSVASQHLAILSRAKLIEPTRNGKFIYYSLNEDRLAEVESLVNLMQS